MSRIETETVTQNFTITRSTVHYADGDKESFNWVLSEPRNDTIVYYKEYEDEASVYQYSFNDEVNISLSEDWDEQVKISEHNFKKIEKNWVDEMVAVAEVEVEVTDRLLREPNRELLDDEVEVEVWERPEWEAHGEE